MAERNSIIICYGFRPIYNCSLFLGSLLQLYLIQLFLTSNSQSLSHTHTHNSAALVYVVFMYPLENQLSHIGIINDHSSPTNQSATDNTTPPASSHSRSRTSLVLAQLVSRIESGAFNEMADLLPKWLGTYYYDEESKAQKEAISHQHTGVFAVLCSLRCSRGQMQPELIQDFLGYQAIIIDVYLEYKCNCWMGYDQCF